MKESQLDRLVKSIRVDERLKNIEKRVNSLEVKNDGDELHVKINKEWLKTDIGVTTQEAMDNMNNAIGIIKSFEQWKESEGINDLKYFNSPMIKKTEIMKDYLDYTETFNNGKQWIDLDIDNLPERFFTRDDIEIYNDKFGQIAKKLTKEIRLVMIEDIIKNGVEYRYRIQEEVTHKFFRTANNYDTLDGWEEIEAKYYMTDMKNYRYMVEDHEIQEKKPIQITQEMADKEIKPHKAWSRKDHAHVISTGYKREVIIID